MNPYQAGGVFLSGWIACTLLVLRFWRLLATGKIRTEREVDEIRKTAEAADRKADTWRQAWQERESAFNLMAQQNARLSNVAEVANHILESLPKPGGSP